MIRAVGFDLGDTLIEYKGIPLNWRAHYRPALQMGLNKIDINLSDAQFHEYESILLKYNTRENPREVELSAAEIFSEIQHSLLLQTNQCSILMQCFFEYFQQKSEPYGDTIQVLNHLKQAGFKIGILTDVAYGMPDEFIKVDIESINGHVDRWITSVHVGFRKPNKTGYLMLADELGVAPEEIVYVGNEHKDMLGARLANYKHSILINRSSSSPDFGQDYHFQTLTEVANLLCNKRF